jgi:PAS domain S-box-containing protein
MAHDEQIQDALKECEGKFLKLFRESPLVLLLTSTRDERYIEVNDTFERSTGWKRDEVIGRTPDDLKIWVDPSQRVNFVKQLLSGGTVRNFEIHGRMKNGEVRTGSASAAMIDINGEACVLTLIEDTTDIRRAEEVKQVAEHLSSALRRLIQAQEEERTSIARELHKYIDCLALLSIALDRLQQNPHQSVAEAHHEIEKARQQVKDLVSDIRTLSHSLHSSKLEYLGLAAAASSLCKEFSDQRKLEIDFVSEGSIPKELPNEIALCLYRVLQEALQNATEHSGSRVCEVTLSGESDEIRLVVRDWGVGFDPAAALKGNALGITYMKERLKLVDGELVIESQPQQGTTIRARVPLKEKAKSTEAS